jgi:hypothetical protein
VAVRSFGRPYICRLNLAGARANVRIEVNDITLGKRLQTRLFELRDMHERVGLVQVNPGGAVLFHDKGSDESESAVFVPSAHHESLRSVVMLISLSDARIRQTVAE